MEPVPGPPDADVAFVDKWGSQESLAIIGYRSEGDNLRFLDPEAEEVHRWIGTLFPGVLAKCESFSRDDRRIIVSLSSDRNPGVYFLLDRAAKKATPLSRAYAAIDPNLMAPTRTFRFAAGDGLPLSGRITLPAGVAKPPLVVVVGPSFTSPAPEGFDRTAQFFASRGYATARINHRGVIGFGRSFLIAGDLQVATGMASDLAEGVKWLAAQGWTDPHRVALFADQWGALTAVPLAARADAFRAIVNLSPPLDLAKLTADDFLATAGRSEEELALVAGDSKTFAAYRNSVDPVAAIGRISIPAFYHFERGAGEVVPGPVRHLEERLKKQGAVYELDIAPSLAKWDVLKLGSYPEWKEEARTFDAVGGFLQMHL